MSDTIHRYDIKTNRDNVVLEVSVFYGKGGMSMFTYKMEPRGYWLSIKPVEITKGEGYTGRAFLMFGAGRKAFLLETKRKGGKAETEALRLSIAKVDELTAAVLAHAQKEYPGLVLVPAQIVGVYPWAGAAAPRP